MNEPKGRHELKHSINYSDMLQLRRKLPSVMRRDGNADADGGYRIRSLYFDNYGDKALREKIDGVDTREKFRLRFYNGDTSFIRLEKKSKRRGLCFKQSARVPLEACRALIEGDCEPLRQCGGALCLELYAKTQSELLRPKNIVDYRREAFFFPAGNVRVTLDYDIRASLNPPDFLNESYVSVPVAEGIVLEVKYDEFLPELIRGVVSLSSRQAAAFSKYAAARKKFAFLILIALLKNVSPATAAR